MVLMLLSSLSPFLILLDYRKKHNMHIPLIYIPVSYLVLFLVSKLAYHYGLFLAALAPILLLLICILKKKR